MLRQRRSSTTRSLRGQRARAERLLSTGLEGREVLGRAEALVRDEVLHSSVSIIIAHCSQKSLTLKKSYASPLKLVTSDPSDVRNEYTSFDPLLPWYTSHVLPAILTAC